MKVKIRLDDPQIRAVWECAQKAKDEVDAWPAWKRGDHMKCFHCGHPYRLEDEICKNCHTQPTGAELELLHCRAKIEKLETEISRLNLILNNSSEKGKPND